jgi:hypothetical protein
MLFLFLVRGFVVSSRRDAKAKRNRANQGGAEQRSEAWLFHAAASSAGSNAESRDLSSR